ncbi:MAG TPA: hypothetical protein VEU28_10015, partial [Actinomycetota bacterium]|nr:hypothetical protein [Actinomycetota bacterium]
MRVVAQLNAANIECPPLRAPAPQGRHAEREPTMDHVRILATELAFEPFLYDHHLALPERDREYLQAVCLVLHGSPRFRGTASITAPADIRLYLDGVEVTAAYVAELRSVLDQQPADLLRAQYDRALQSWIKLAEGLGIAYGFDVARDKADRERLL